MASTELTGEKKRLGHDPRPCEVEGCAVRTRTGYWASDPDGGLFNVALCRRHGEEAVLEWRWEEHDYFVTESA